VLLCSSSAAIDPNYMDNLSKARIFVVIAFKMVVLMAALVFGLKALYVFVPKYLGIPFPRSLYGLCAAAGAGGVYGWAMSSYRRRTRPPQVKSDDSAVA
jgi:hypothetical protein